jgi:hypothetical protein
MSSKREMNGKRGGARQGRDKYSNRDVNGKGSGMRLGGDE